MTGRRFEVFTQRSGDTVFTTRFRFVARLVTRYVRTLDYWLAEMAVWTTDNKGTAVRVTECKHCPMPAVLLTDRFEPVCAGCYPIPLLPVHRPLFPTDPIYWCPDCQAGACPGLQIGQCYVEGCAHDCNQDEHESAPDCGHDYAHDELGRCLYPHADRVCGWHPEEGPAACPSRIPTPESLRRGELCYYGQCGRCRGEGCPEFWLGFKKAEGEYLEELRSHNCQTAGCGPVCTAFEPNRSVDARRPGRGAQHRDRQPQALRTAGREEGPVPGIREGHEEVGTVKLFHRNNEGRTPIYLDGIAAVWPVGSHCAVTLAGSTEDIYLAESTAEVAEACGYQPVSDEPSIRIPLRLLGQVSFIPFDWEGQAPLKPIPGRIVLPVELGPAATHLVAAGYEVQTF